jgi:hypothetical protein
MAPVPELPAVEVDGVMVTCEAYGPSVTVTLDANPAGCSSMQVKDGHLTLEEAPQ